MDRTSYRTTTHRRRPRVATGPPRRRRSPLITAVGVGALLLLAILALGHDTSTLRQTGIWSLFGIRASTTGKQILEDLLTRYQGLTSYEDRTLMRMRIDVDQRRHEEAVDMMVRYVRPAKLRLHVNLSTIQLLVTSDGQQLHSRILAEANKQFDRQFVEHPAPSALSLSELLSATEIVSVEKPDQMQSILMSLPCPLPISQLSLLFDPEFMQQLIATSSAIERLPDQPLGGRDCVRVQLTASAGKFVFWIDVNDRLLRRIEYPDPGGVPNEGIESAAPAQSIASPVAQLSVDYDNIKINGVFPPSAFRQLPPPKAALVRHFVVPPENDAANILGRRVSNYWFTELTGGRMLAEQLDAAVNVLVWFNNRAPSRAVMDELKKVYNARPEAVKIIGVCTEPTTAMSHDDIRQLKVDWQIPFPIVRDLQAFGRDVFAVNHAPTLVAVDRHGTVQLFEVGGNAEMSDKLLIVFDKLKAGEPLAQNYLDFLEAQGDSFRRLLAAASIHPPPGSSDTPLQIKPSRSEVVSSLSEVGEESGVKPDTSQGAWFDKPLPNQTPVTASGVVNRVWGTQLGQDDIYQIDVVESATDRFLIAGDSKAVVYELAMNGQRRETFPLVGAQGQDQLRTLVLSPTRTIFATFGSVGPLYVFDKRWISRFAYPQPGSPALQVTDAVVEDLDADGEPEIYLALRGSEIHRVDLRGQQVWRLDSLHAITSLTVSHDRSGQRYLLVTHDDRRVTPLNAQADQFESITLDLNVWKLLASPRRSEDGSFCAVGRQSDGNWRVAGLDANFEQIWERSLSTTSSGASHVVRWVPWTMDEKQGAWLIHTAADEFVIVCEDGSVAKSLSMRFPLRAAVGTTDVAGNLLVGAAENTVMAWRIELD